MYYPILPLPKIFIEPAPDMKHWNQPFYYGAPNKHNKPSKRK